MDSSDVSDSDYYSDDLDFIDDHIGDILNNDYIIISKLGSGAYATVWLSYSYSKKKYYAIKINNIDDSNVAEKEIEIYKNIKKLNNTYLNNIIDHFIHETEVGNHVCMVFDLLAGSVYDIIRHTKGLDIKQVKSIVRQLLLALLDLNKSKIHTDLKPENILIEGVSHKTSVIIQEFKKLNFDALVKKNISGKCKNKAKNLSSALEKAVEKIEDKLFDINEKYDPTSNTCTNSHSRSCSSDNDLDPESELEVDSDDLKYDLEPEVKLPTDTIDDKYLKNIRIRLSDFGNCVDINHDKYDIQTRHYRSPEVILNYRYDHRVDVWSIGCIIYELLTGHVLFNPTKHKNNNRDRNHIYSMICMLGPIPEYLIKLSEKRDVFFRHNNLLKGFNNIEYKPLYKNIYNELKDKLSKDDITDVIDILYRIFNYDCYKRPEIQDLLDHNFVK
jgi:serine/threonine-protein kinase SRPK3